MLNSSCALLYSRGRADMLVIRDQRIKKETGKSAHEATSLSSGTKRKEEGMQTRNKGESVI